MAEKIKILMIEDNKGDFVLMERNIDSIDRKKYSLEWAPSYESGMESVLKQNHDIYFIDYYLDIPTKTGMDLIENALRNGCEAPMILLTGLNQHVLNERALKAGAADFLVKGVMDKLQLENSIRYSIEHAKKLKEIKKLNTSLESRIKERTIVLEDALIQLKEQAHTIRLALNKEKELNDLKSRFISMASHEFRTPLAVIVSSVNLIEKYNSPNNEEKRKSHIKKIKSSIKGLNEILVDVLNIGQIEKGIIKNNPEKINIVSIIEKIIGDYKNISEGHRFKYEHKGKSQNGFLDVKLLKTCLDNIIGNAVKYSLSEGNIKIISELTDSPKTLTISVKDNGIGIPEEDKDHIFEQFFRAKNAETFPGTGLGLNIIKNFISIMGGSISFNSEENKGTTFVLNFPEN